MGKPIQTLHLAQFEVLTKLSREDAVKHGNICRSWQWIHAQADIMASEARAKGVAPQDVARLWLSNTKRMSKEKLQTEDSITDMTSPLHMQDLEVIVRYERTRGRMEGCLFGIGAAIVACM